MVARRIFFGALLIAMVLAIVVLDGVLSRPLWETGQGADITQGVLLRRALPITMLVLLVLTLATFELGRLCRNGGYQPAVGWAAFVVAGLILIPWIDMQKRTIGADVLVDLPTSAASLTVLWLTGGFLGAVLAILYRRRTQKAVESMAVTLFIACYLGLLGSFVTRIRCFQPDAGGAALVVYFILTVKAGDMGAYFIGMSLGKRKLAPWLSPAKTIEGFLGAVLVCILVAAAGTWLWVVLPETLGPPPVTLPQALVFGVVMAVVGHLGDLVESAIKRDVGSKDSGQLVPAFGGLLDIIDSPLMAAPVAWWMLTSGGPVG